MRGAVAYAIRAVLAKMCDQRARLAPSQFRDCAKTARRLLTFSTSTHPRDRWLVTHALQCVCRTYEDDPVAAGTLLRAHLTPQNLDEHGAEEMFWIASEMKRLASVDPEIVSDVFSAAFGREEESRDPTDMISSRIIPMTSNRKQDWESARHVLGEDYIDLLRASPSVGARTLLKVVGSYVAREHRPPSGRLREEHFDFRGRRCRIVTDYSSIWDEGRQFRVDDELKMLDAFEAFLLESHSANSIVDPILDEIAERGSWAVVWRRILEAGAQRPESIGNRLKALAWTPPILHLSDTSKVAGDFLSAVFPLLSAAERERVETSVLGLAQDGEDDNRTVDRLLGCLSYSLLVTPMARERLGALQRTSSVPANAPPFAFSEFSHGRFGEEEYLSREGVPIQDEANRRVRELERPVQEFAERYANGRPLLADLVSVTQSLKDLFIELNDAGRLGVHPKQAMHAWDALAGAAARAVTIDSLDCSEETGRLLKTILMRASEEPEPVHHPELDSQFDKGPAWSSPAPRIEAAAGVTALAHHAACVDEEVLGRIDTLSQDPVPAVRFQVAVRLLSLYRTAPDSMWGLVRRMAGAEASRGVLHGLVAGVLGRLAGSHAEEVLTLTQQVFTRVAAGEPGDELRRACVSIFTGVYLWQGRAGALEALDALLADPVINDEELRSVVTQLRDVLTHGRVTDETQEQRAVRHRAFSVLRKLLDVGLAGLRQLDDRGVMRASTTPSERDRAEFKSFGGLVNHIGTEMYFASGSYAARQPEERQKADPQVRRRFYQEAQSILVDLADVGYPGLVHHLLETLEMCIPFDERGVFLLVNRVLRAGKQWGYQHESLAVKLFVAIVERYLAESGGLFRHDPECRAALLESLDIFVTAGWPEARRLTYRLDEIYR